MIMDCSPIAIIGLGCRYPGAASPHELWQNLVDGVESIGAPPPWRAGHFVPGQKGGFLDDIDFFDASFFKINPQIADQMDPQQRLLLELTWSALEDAGLDPGSLRGSNTAVVIGMGDNEYAKLADAREDHLTFPNFLGCHPSIPANRISQSFGFSGFSACIYTACSSALVAVDLACRELWLKRSQLAIAAGVNLIFAPKVSQVLINSGWHSKRGQCRPLDTTADGYVRSEGVGVAVLKPLEQALVDGDRIYALIQDCRTRHNGQGNGLALPCLHSQIDLLSDVYSSPGVDPADLFYVELNAVGAKVGDVIELKALAAAVGKQRRGAQPLKVGSLKPNIGHSEAASGMAGLIKTALALHHKQLPPTLNYQACDPSFNLDALGFSVPTTLEPIHPSNKPVLAGISAFGFGGTNAHILLREPPQQVQSLASSHSAHVLMLSAATHEGLRERCAILLDFLRSNSSLSLADICWTVNRSRSQLPVRVAITAASFAQLQARLVQSLHSPDSSQPGVPPHVAVPRAVPPQLGFVFTGRCAFSLNALAEIAVHHESVRQALNVAQRLLGSCRQDDLPPGIIHIVGEVILHQLWMAWGVEPRVRMAEPLGRAAAAIANAVATADSDLETEFQKLISAPDLHTAPVSECPAPPVAIGQEPILIQMGSGQVGSPAELAELDGLASSAAGTAWETLLVAAVRLAERGVPVAWSKVCGSQHGRVVSLPTYPFARERHWLGEPSQPTARLGGLEGDPGHDIALATPLERKLHAIWTDVLGHSDFGITDNFFLVGGHSLAAGRLVARIAQTTGHAPPLAALFQNPSIAALASVLHSSGVTPENSAPSPSLTAIAATGPLAGDWPQGCQAFLASYAQARLWFLQQLQRDLTAYHLPTLWRLSGQLDREALAQALTDLIERHPTLRTSFQLRGSEVLQLIHPPIPIQLELESLGDRDPEAVVQAWLQQEDTTPFDLASGLLLRARLLAISEQEHVLLINHHHIASDGWSLSLLSRDLTALYNAQRSGQASGISPLQVNYHDYAAWQRDQLSGDRLQALKRYWIEQLTALEPLELPTDHPRPATPSHQGASHFFRIEPALLAPFEQLCRSEAATLQMGLLALVALLLHRYSRQDDFAIGIPIWGRNHPDLEHLIGFFVNTLPIRTLFSADLSFRQLLQQVKTTSINAYDHQELPFEQIVEALNLERDTSRNPLVQVMLQLIELHEPSLSNLDGLAVEPIQSSTASSRLDLEFFLRRDPDGGLNTTLVYATDLFCADRIQRLASHLLSLLASAAQAPDAPAASLNLLPESERLLIESWQHGPKIDLPGVCVHKLFEQQAERTPHSLALVFDDQQLTYAELNARSNQLAHHLIELGIGPDKIVALCLERSLELIISLLAILKAGGAYLPLDPAWPVERQHLLLDEAGCTLLLTAEGPEMIHSPHPVRGAVSGPPLAYITYTSGSTGIPKGVAVGHPSIVRLVNPVNGYQLSAGHRVLQLAPMAFDASTLEIWGPLLNGGTLVIAPPGQLSLQELAEVLRQGRITTVWLTAGLFHAMVESELEALAGVRQVLAGGDVLSPEHVQRLLDAFPPGHGLINGYGPTENTTFTCCHRLAAGDTVDPAGVPLGRPIALTSLQVLGPSGQPCPIGIPGELHIGGAGLAHGYLNNPGLTAEKFIPDPFSSDPTARLYKSGDLASWNSDGTLAFHGRLDQQIKLRGYRIEPAEIEFALIAHPAIKQAVVLLREDQPGSPQLVAYWIPADAAAGKTADDNALSASELRPFLARSLPDYMVPAAFVRLEALPLTPNGKLDRKALPAPSFSGDLQRRVEPSTELQLQLHALWAEVLGHSDFGITDNFFLMGGHSLAATRLVSRIEQTLGSAPSLAALFHNPTIAALEPLLHATSGNADRNDTHLSTLIPLQTGGTKPPLFFMPSSGGHPFGHILCPFLDAQQPVYSFISRGLDGKQNPHTRLEDMAADYVRDMRTLQAEGPYFLAGYSFGTRLAFEVAQQLRHQGQQVAFLALIDSVASLGRAPSETSANSSSLLSVKEANRFAFFTYIPQYYAGIVTLFRAEEMIYRLYYPEGTGGWGDLALGGIEIHDFPCGHGLIGLAREILGEKLRISLEKAQAIAFQSSRRPQEIFLAEQDYSPKVAQDTPLFYRYLSREYLKKADLDREIASYQKAIKLDPRQPDWVYLNLGDALIEEGRLDEAITIYHDGLMFHPFNPKLFESLSAAHIKGGESEQALNCWKKVIALNPVLELDNVHNQYGNDLKPERLTMALSAYQKAVGVHSQFLANIYKNLGLVQSQNGELKKAIASYRQGISLSPEFVPLYISLGRALIKEGKLEEAFDTFQEVIGLDSHREEAYLGLGDLRRQQGNMQEAIVNFQKAVELNPNHAGANKGLGDCFRDLGKVDEAITAYGK
ncbi:MAG TPA: hypothetical protein DDY43_03300, partial [Synechococcales bacterium UBA10510]|nr:hypothetical protein [Synechococcales bacterium UBA10510]